jgi:chromosome segregation ATPase
MRAKDLEERLKKSDAEKQLMEVHLGEEIHKLSTELDTLKQTLGHRSSYASKAAQSVKSLVELTEGQKSELEYQRDCLSTQLAILQQNQDKLKGRNQHLEASAMEEATARVRETLGSLESQCESLRNENKIRKEQFDVLQETLKRDQDILKSKTDTVYKLEKQVSCHVTAAEVVESG